MAERPILFTPENAQKVHLGLKTQTRRITPVLLPGDKNYIFAETTEEWREKRAAQAPFRIGDRLWVREAWVEAYQAGPAAWSILRPTGFKGHGKAFYKGGFPEKPDEAQISWRNAMFMPRWASRTTLEVLEVRAERVGDISEEDARAEGADLALVEDYDLTEVLAEASREFQPEVSWVVDFQRLWDSINGKKPGCNWKSNPWVWVYTFRKEAAHG